MAKKKQKITVEVIEEYLDEITFECPVRGKVTEQVLVKRYKGPEVPDEPLRI